MRSRPTELVVSIWTGHTMRPYQIEFRASKCASIIVLCLGSGIALGQAAPEEDSPFIRTDAMVPMRDGVKLFTRIHAPKNQSGTLPIIFLRTPYGIDGRAERQFKAYLRDLIEDGYIFVSQDIRGRYKSEGQFVMTRPPRDRTDPKSVD